MRRLCVCSGSTPRGGHPDRAVRGGTGPRGFIALPGGMGTLAEPLEVFRRSGSTARSPEEVGDGHRYRAPERRPRCRSPRIVEWARRAEAAGFSTLDRVVYPDYESLIVLAAAAAVTERIRLMTNILIAPLRTNRRCWPSKRRRSTAFSEGRLVLGLAPGGREDGDETSGADFHSRGRTFDRQLEELTTRGRACSW